MSEDESESRMDVFTQLSIVQRPDEGRGKFPEVVGLCRTCSHAHITRRQYNEVPVVICGAVKAHRVMLDIKECSSYSKKGELSLFDMSQMAVLIDSREVGGQYL